MKLKQTIGNLAIAAVITGGALLCHTRSADAANHTDWSYEDECVEKSCSNGEVEDYHEEYEQESLVEWGSGNLEEDMEAAANTSNRRNRACASVTMLNDFASRLGRRIDTDDLQQHEWICQHL